MILLDTHVWLYWIVRSGKGLSADMLRAIREADIAAISSVSCWEVVMLAQRQRIVLPIPVHQWVQRALGPARIRPLAVTCEIAARAASLAQHHKDPADRIIIATAIEHDARLLSLDAQFPAYAELGGRLLGS
jgi:PIN domain nuclease of toxin-antitoxin system